MKLKNKKTGEIKPAEAREDGIYLYDKTTEQWYKYELSLLAEYWEYYEEPKGYWYIRDDGSGVGFSPLNDSTVAHRRSIIGDYFESEEEAKRALEKLKAWERLKDKNFKFRKLRTANIGGDKHYFAITAEVDDADKTDLDLLFSGGEDG